MADPTLRTALPGLGRVMRRFRPWIRPQRGLLAGGMVALLAEVVLRLLEPWPLKLILDRVIQPDPGRVSTGLSWADSMTPGTLLAFAAAAVVVIVGVRALAQYASTVAFALAGNRVLTAVRAELYGHLQRLHLDYHSGARGGDLITRLTGDVGRLQEVTVTAVLPLVGNVVTFVGMVAVMLWLDVGLALIALTALPVFALTMVRLTRRIRHVSRVQRVNEGALASTAAESLGAIKVVQSYSLEPRMAEAFACSNDKSLKDGVKAKRLAAGLERKTDLLIGVGTGLVLFFGARRVLAGALTPGDLVVFVTYLKSAFKPMRDLAKYTGRIAKAAASGERIVDVLDTLPAITDSPRARPAPRFRGDIRLHQVTFGYDPARPVLRELDLHVKPGERIALVGPSGTGKSSLVSLIARLYEPQSGTILIDGMDIQEFTLDSLRSQVALLLQESVLFATTIRENIAYGAPGVTDEQIERAARLANAHDFITALPDGYDTVLSERGSTLSGGQRQRIAIARAAVRDAPIVLLDEPTTGLDQENESEVTAALANLVRGRTTFVIAHDLATVTDADRILYIDEGTVVESGSHRQLIAAKGRYAATYTLQRRSQPRRPPAARSEDCGARAG